MACELGPGKAYGPCHKLKKTCVVFSSVFACYRAETWEPARHWALALVRLKVLLATGTASMLALARITSPDALWATLWVISKIIMRKNRPNDYRRLKKTLESKEDKAAIAKM